jgi:DEAD/DEAH box helicase domain-containing protein
VHVTSQVVGFKKIKFHTHENVGYGDVHLPEMQMHTTAFWLTFPESLVAKTRAPRPMVVDAVRGLGHALHTLAAIGLMTDPRDLGMTLGDGADGDLPAEKGEGGAGLFAPTLFLYDNIPGGVGLATRLFAERRALLGRAAALLATCTCADGCPACIGPAQSLDPARGSSNRRDLARRLLELAGVSAER